MDAAQRAALRLECLKLAVQMEGRNGPTNVLIGAETLFAWVTTQQEPAKVPEKAAKK